MDIADREDATSALNSFKATTIQSGHTVLLRLPSGETKGFKVEKDATISIGRVGSFRANELIGHPYGLTYEIRGKELTVQPPHTLQEVEETDATNELINDGEFVQPLTLGEIEGLKKSGVHASVRLGLHFMQNRSIIYFPQDIIKAQIEQHANYSLKTEYSKEKYKQRKEAKYSKTFSTVEPTIYNVCDHWFKKDQNRIRDIRPDTLSQILNLANVRPGGRYIVVDEASGLLVSAILERLGGEGRLISICDVDSPPAYPVMTLMNFRKDVVTNIHSSLNWATAQEDYTPAVAQESSSEVGKSERHRIRLDKRKNAADTLLNAREELFAGEFDALLIASDYDSLEILQNLILYVAGSGSIVVQSPFSQPLTELQSKLRLDPGYLAPSITESWLRRYQVLPGRTHPTMSTSGSGGFLLHAIKVYDDPNASKVSSHRQSKRQKKEADEGNPTVPQTLESYQTTELEGKNATVADQASLTNEMEPIG
ncbi:Gcd10p-domain-containing protein [Suillus plorans]|uniref:tRNA (adenine(58)-N(1))-methyltransferase non-catalytic subunit TRM6 n=1 Tax=Suillus plorans TaxID=116603 RepID=A0A9P7ASN7_9AGAM|nr:Gcd10p-domain-containing protein [Suillus plorans]KAG1795702.1 Gcd10p-domain-containing protein [Suillus plorans]